MSRNKCNVRELLTDLYRYHCLIIVLLVASKATQYVIQRTILYVLGDKMVQHCQFVMPFKPYRRQQQTEENTGEESKNEKQDNWHSVSCSMVFCAWLAVDMSCQFPQNHRFRKCARELLNY